MIVKRASYFILGITTLFFVAVLLSGCSSTEKLQSNWDTSEMKIDGDFSDWENSLHAIKNEGVSLGFKNNDKFLYLCLITTDRGKMMQMMRAGFIVWFYPQKDDGKIFGIKYPMPFSMLNLDREDRQDFNKELFQPEKMDDMLKKMLDGKNEFQVINEENFPLGQFGLENTEGIKAKLGYNADRFVYELQVPLATNKNYAYQVASLPGEKLKIKFETLELQFEEMGGPGMRPGFGGLEGSEGKRLGGEMKKGEGGQFTRPQPFNYEVEILLQQQLK